MRFKKQIFGFMDMLRFKKLVPKRREHLANGSSAPLPENYKVNILAKKLHPGSMKVELTDIREVSSGIKEFVFKRLDENSFPFFRAGQYVSVSCKIGESFVSRPYSIASSPRDALNNRLAIAVEDAGFFSGYMNREAKIGDRFDMTEPSGAFHYEKLRDKKHIACVAGGSGITPFISMAKSMAEKDEEYEMTLFYGARDEAHLAYKSELDILSATGLKVIYVLSDEKNEKYEHGFITAALLEKYVDIQNVTFFLCGPKNMYAFIQKELSPYNLPVKAIRKDASSCGDRDIENPAVFSLKVHIRDDIRTVNAYENETLLTALERAGISVPNKCRAGGCGYCHSKLIKGEFYVADGRDGRREADKKFGFIHPCVTYPSSDIEIDIPVTK